MATGSDVPRWDDERFLPLLASAWRDAIVRDEREPSLSAAAIETVLREFVLSLKADHVAYATRPEFLESFVLAYEATENIVRGVHRECHALALALFDLLSETDESERYRTYGRAHQVLGHAVLALSARRLDGMNKVTKRDELTALLNRRAYDEDLARGIGTGTSFVLTMIDMDGLKAVNDTQGHAAGSQLICDFAIALQTNVQAADPSGTTYRWGGDEFAAILPGLSLQEATTALEALQVSCPFSFGCSAYPTETTQTSTLTALADGRMYEQKKQRKWRRYTWRQKLILRLAQWAGVARK